MRAAKIEAIVKPEPNTTGAKCENCLLGRCITVTFMQKGEEAGKDERCECHMARPTSAGFPQVRRDDWCSLHVQAGTTERTFGGVVAQTFQ